VETAPPNCLGDEISPIGQSIADEYESASYEQVMTWFCNGAEFEDILTALETESQTGTPAEEMLLMLADGFTWEEIWQMIGLTD
jgi:ActR/RegA family two-component response regulator